jgi:wyosine [tRNA(Phe)-imidazoG37] synthetase (radical SAM superfamily)
MLKKILCIIIIKKHYMNVFGPVPSRRLGKSLGINNIPYKICTYSCIYCQIGKAVKMIGKRQEFYKPDELLKEAKTVLRNLKDNSVYPDYITLVPDGEPTLDIHLGKLIEKLKTINLPVAVITNASLMNHPDVQNELLQADYISVKIDTVNHVTWRKINKPYKSLELKDILNGIRSFKKDFKGKLTTETMLIKGINDTLNEFIDLADYISNLNPDIAYLAIPTRPPAFKTAIPVDESKINEAYHIFSKKLAAVEFLTGYEGNAFSSTGYPKEDIMSITAVHPMREDAVEELLKRNNASFNLVHELLEDNLIRKINFNGKNYYIRKFSK